MPHYKCVACKYRLHHTAGSPADFVGDLCPGCGFLLEPVGELAEIVGFKSIESRDSAPDGDEASTRRRRGGGGNLAALEEAIRAQARLDDERSLDDCGSPNPAGAVAMALPTPATPAAPSIPTGDTP